MLNEDTQFKESIDIDTLTSIVKKSGDDAHLFFQKNKKNIYTGLSNKILKEKSEKELLINQDLVCEEIIIDEILKVDSNAVIYSEERDNLSELRDDKSFIKYLIDPLDGTHNYYYGLPFWGISLAVLDTNNIPITGIIYLPCLNILLRKSNKQKYSFLYSNNNWLRVKAIDRVTESSIIAYDNQFYKIGEPGHNLFKKITKYSFTTRISGSAVVDAAYIALGVLNARLFNHARSYDIAASIPIVKGSGGIVTNFKNESVNLYSRNVLMSSGSIIHKKLLEIIDL